MKAENESGRSMVEMLGVLAIIGVISIGAIGGYTYGMNRYRTNEILDGGTKRAYTVATQLSMGLQPNLSEFKDYNTTAGGVFGDTGSIKQWDGEFGISISGVTKPVCENLIRMIGDKTPLRALSKGKARMKRNLPLGIAQTEVMIFTWSITSAVLEVVVVPTIIMKNPLVPMIENILSEMLRCAVRMI